MHKIKIVLIGLGILIIAIGAVVFAVVHADENKEANAGTEAKLPVAQPWLAASEVAKINKAAGGGSGQLAFVLRIVDGDTILVQTFDSATGEPAEQERVRYVGMDTPETVKPNAPVECFGHEASARDKELVAGKYVWLERDVSDRDKYGRLLRFVYLANISVANFSIATTSVDLQLVQGGYARVLTIPPDVEDKAQFLAAASSAVAAHLGFWGACPTYPFQS